MTETGSAPAISVVIPYYAEERWIGRAVRSALAQSLPPAEVVIIDDASPEPLDPARFDDARVRVIRQPANAGPAAARNAGVGAATGELIAFLDADDVWLKGKLAGQLARLRAAEAEAEGGSGLIVCASGYLLSKSFTPRLLCGVPFESSDPLDFAMGCWFCPGSTALMRRETFDAVGSFDEGLRRLEDIGWYGRFGLMGGRLVASPTVTTIIMQDAKTGSARVAGAIPPLLAGLDVFARAKAPALRRPFMRRLRAYADLELASSLWAEGRRAPALALLARSLALRPRRTLWLKAFLRETGLDAATMGL